MRVTAPVEYELVSRIDDLFSDKPRSFQVEDALLFPDAIPLLFQHLGSAYIAERHERKASCKPIIISAIPNAIVSHRSTVGTEATVYLLGDPVPTYVDNYLRDGRSPPDSFCPPKSARHMRGISAVVTHWNSSIYGHWLMEGLPKLFLLREMLPTLPVFRIIAPSSYGQIVKDWSAILLPGIEIEIFDSEKESLHCESILLPSWLGGGSHRYHSSFNRMIDDVILQHGIKNIGRRIYVSRENENPYRSLSNKTEIESIATSEGFEVIIPEKLPVLDQLTLFGSSDWIVGPFGSAMHNALFSPTGANILCLNWVNDLQSNIAHLRRQLVGYIMPKCGPVAFDRADPMPRSFEIEPDSFRSSLQRWGKITTLKMPHMLELGEISGRAKIIFLIIATLCSRYAEVEFMA